MSIVNPFAPAVGTGQNVTTGAASASVTLGKDLCVRVVNYGATNPARIRIGKGAQTAVATDTIIRANSEVIFYKGEEADTLAYIQDAAATTLHIQTGIGGT